MLTTSAFDIKECSPQGRLSCKFRLRIKRDIIETSEGVFVFLNKEGVAKIIKV